MSKSRQVDDLLVEQEEVPFTEQVILLNLDGIYLCKGGIDYDTTIEKVSCMLCVPKAHLQFLDIKLRKVFQEHAGSEGGLYFCKAGGQ